MCQYCENEALPLSSFLTKMNVGSMVFTMESMKQDVKMFQKSYYICMSLYVNMTKYCHKNSIQCSLHGDMNNWLVAAKRYSDVAF